MLHGQTISLFYKDAPKHYLGYVKENKTPVILIPGLLEKWGCIKFLGDKISLAGHPVYIIPKLGNNVIDIPSSANIVQAMIEEKDIKTIDYSIWPKYTYQPTICSLTYCPPSRQIEDGYTVSHSVSVKIRKTADAGKALALVGEKGATNLSSISFAIDDPEKILDEARAKAIADAKGKAKLLSRELGVRLVRVVSFYDNTGGGVPYYAEGMGGDTVKSKSVAPTIPIGENKSVVSVTVVYEIR